jgi:hypothetical protein
MRTLERVLAALEALLPPLVAYYEDARVIGVCVDPSCTRTGGADRISKSTRQARYLISRLRYSWGSSPRC